MEKINKLPCFLLPDVMARHAKWQPDKTAIICGERKITWREFNQNVNKVSNALIGQGLIKGDKVSILMTSSIQMLEIMLGVMKAGGVIVPLSNMVPVEGLVMMVNDSESKFLFADTMTKDLIAPYRDSLSNISSNNLVLLGSPADGWITHDSLIENASIDNPVVDLGYEDDFNIIYTSGTTGAPKGILHTHFSRAQFALGLAIEFRFKTTSVSLFTTPLYTNGTWMMMLPTVLVGGTMVIMPQFDPQGFLGFVDKEKCTHTFMVPTQFVVVMDQPDFGSYDLSSMEVMVSAGAPLRKDTKEKILKEFKCGLLELYGVTEGVASTLKPEDVADRIASVGTPSFGGDLRIIDEHDRELPWGEIGEIVGYSATAMRGYYKQPDKTAEAIWKDERGRRFIRTGDIGRFDQDGYLYILERKKDMIISGGINIFSIDLEEVISKHPDVIDVAVIGIPHEKWGETPLALVISKNGSKMAESELTEWANEKLGNYQRISGVEFRDDFPRNALGKVLKRKLREPYLE